jgi:hypothetical protein
MKKNVCLIAMILVVVLSIIVAYFGMFFLLNINFFTTLSVLLTLVLVVLTAFIVCTTYLQYLMANTPFIDGDMVKDKTNTYLDLKIINKGPGVAVDIEWNLKVEGMSKEDYINASKGKPSIPTRVDDLLVFSNSLFALSRDDRYVTLKGYIPSIGNDIDCKGEKSNGSQSKYVLFLKYKKLMNRNKYHCVKFVFLTSGYKCFSTELPDCNEFNHASIEIKHWKESVNSSYDKHTS